MITKCFSAIISIALLTSCDSTINKNNTDMTGTKQDSVSFKSGYAPVNKLKMYYEIYGEGKQLVLIHGGGSTIQSTFARVIPEFSKHRQVIAVELQAHGRTADIDRPETFEQDADDVAALLDFLKIKNADFFGFSNGGNTTMRIATRHPGLVRKIVLGSSFFKREGMYPQFWESMSHVTINDMPQQLKDAYLKVTPDSSGLLKMFMKDKARMLEFTDWKAEDIRSINAPALVIATDLDVVRPEHTVEMYRLLPHAKLSIFPGLHGAYIGEVTTGMENSKIPELAVAMIEEFLDEAAQEKK
jgi:pimeloyl-ACP methyl ester carboxylesterase